MKKFEVNKNINRGSATLEMTLIIPLVLWIVVNVIFIFIDSINDSVIRSEVYTSLYSYNVDVSNEEEEGKLLLNINEHLIGVYTVDELELSSDAGVVSVAIDSGNISGGEVHEYKINDMEFSTEFDLCTSRLRRWQLYGDILPQ
ncbi:MAG: hypothetical protein E7259_07645 [Lachnospiraceae bacterium]|nr:hypothetical protein [Lachnospiraceae bacterium]